jgi:hypothetical protein
MQPNIKIQYLEKGKTVEVGVATLHDVVEYIKLSENDSDISNMFFKYKGTDKWIDTNDVWFKKQIRIATNRA